MGGTDEPGPQTETVLARYDHRVTVPFWRSNGPFARGCAVMDETPFTERELYLTKLIEMQEDQLSTLFSTRKEVRRLHNHNRTLLLAAMAGALRQLQAGEVERVIQFLQEYVERLRNEMKN